MKRMVIRIWFKGTQQYVYPEDMRELNLSPVSCFTFLNNEFCEIDWY